MAKDVKTAFVHIVAQFGGRSAESAATFVAELKKSNRHQQEVY